VEAPVQPQLLALLTLAAVEAAEVAERQLLAAQADQA
jgi:hypothetical protein